MWIFQTNTLFQGFPKMSARYKFGDLGGHVWPKNVGNSWT
jgi:hypothetical protein